MAPTRRQRGLGLVEVLVAMALGLVMLGAVGYLFVGSKQMNRTQADQARMQESARNAMDVLGKALRQAGYKLNVDQPLAADALEGVDGGGSGAAAPSDTLVVRHDPAWVRDTAVPPNPLLGRESNCEGVTVASTNLPDAITGAPPVNTTMIEYGFVVEGGKLLCRADPTALTGGVAVADNIERMQVSYGIGNGAEAILNYTDAPEPHEFARVAAVRVSLLIRGPSPNIVAGDGQAYTFNGEVVTSSDGHLRRVVTSTFTVRNQTRW
ncbi:PilW family protein [Massilia soli]|nr:PilW family protein [Massilia soli]